MAFGTAQARYAIGIDVGIVSGIACYDRHIKELLWVRSVPLFRLFEILDGWCADGNIEVFIENPNSWIGFGSKKESAEKAQGAGAVKQTYKHIVEFLIDRNIPHTPTKIHGTQKKLKAEAFQNITKFTGSTNEHGRDAAMIVFKR